MNEMTKPMGVDCPKIITLEEKINECHKTISDIMDILRMPQNGCTEKQTSGKIIDMIDSVNDLSSKIYSIREELRIL